MESLYLKALGLGLAGFDPSGGLIAIALLAAGATRRAVALFCIVYLGGTVVFLSAISWLLRTRLPGTDLRLFDNHPATKAGVEFSVGLILLALAIHRLRHRNDHHETKRRRLPISPWATMGMGLALAVGVVGDPALLAFTVIASTSGSLASIVLSQAIAVVASKILVVAILTVLMASKDDANVLRLRDWWLRSEPTMHRILTGVLFVVAVTLILNALWWYVGGDFLLG